MRLLQQAVPDFQTRVFDTQDSYGFILNSEMPSKPKNELDKRLKAFYDLTRGWLEDNLQIGTATEHGINVVVYLHREVHNDEYPEEQRKKLVPALDDALSYFESLMGHTFKLI